MNAVVLARWSGIATSFLFLGVLAWPAWGKAPASDPLRFAFVSHAPDSDRWWDVIKNSLKHASEDFNVKVVYINPPDGSIDAMAKLIEGLDPKQYDGVVSTIADFDRLRGPLSQLKAKQLPLVTVNTGDEEASKAVGALFHVGQSDFEAGVLSGKRAMGLGARNFLCLNHYPDNRGSFERCKGFAKGLGLEYSEKSMVLELRGNVDQMAAQVRSLGLPAKPGDFWLALGPTSADAGMMALSSVKGGGKDLAVPKLVTYDLSTPIATGIRSGVVAFAVDQQPYAQGYLSIGLLAGFIRLNEPKSLRSALFALYSQPKLHARMSQYGIELKPGTSHFVNSGPGFIMRINLSDVERFSGSYR